MYTLQARTARLLRRLADPMASYVKMQLQTKHLDVDTSLPICIAIKIN